MHVTCSHTSVVAKGCCSLSDSNSPLCMTLSSAVQEKPNISKDLWSDLSSLAVQHSLKESRRDLSSLAAQHYSKASRSSVSSLSVEQSSKESGSSLSSLVPRHSTAVPVQPTLSSLAAQHSAMGSTGIQSGLASQHPCRGSGTVQPSLAQHSVEGSVTLQSGLSRLAAQHSRRENPSSLSSIAVQHSSRESESMQPSLSSLAANHLANERLQQRTLPNKASHYTANDVQPSVSSVTVKYAANKGSGSMQLSQTSNEMVDANYGSKYPSLADLASMHATHVHQHYNSAQSGTSCEKSSVSAPVVPPVGFHSSPAQSSGSSQTVPYQMQPSLQHSGGPRKKTFKTDSDFSVGIRSLSSLNQSEFPHQGIVKEQHSLLQLASLHAAEVTAYKSPPGFDDNIGTINPQKHHPSKFYVPPHSQGTFSGFKPSPAAQPSQFSFVLCRQYSSNRASHNELLRYCHSRVVKELLHAFDSLTAFDFSSSSPDDAVREKQNEGFNRKDT